MQNIIKLLEEENKIKEYRPIPFWSWNDKLEKEELINQIKWMKKQGFGGYFMHARGGLSTEYLSDEWFDCVKACLIAGEENGMQSWAYDENGWPSGFVGGKLLEDPENCDSYLTYSIGDFDANAMASYDISSDKLIRVYSNSGEKCLNVYEHVSTSTVDILNPEVVEKFILETHEKYKSKLGKLGQKNLVGFFTDEPQYYRAMHPYTKMLSKYFKETYGEDVLDKLGLMFVDKDGYREFRYRYWKAMQELMLKAFAKMTYDWCVDNGYGYTGHYIEECHLKMQLDCCAGIMPFYEYQTIPGIDHLQNRIDSPVSPKQVSSVARQLGKKKVLTETFASCGWGVTPTELKRIAEWQFVNGVNLMCQHLLPYSEHGQRKRDYPAHFSWVNPWVREDFKSFNDYFARLGYLIAESTEKVKIAMFSPIRSLYFDYKKYENSEAVSIIDQSYKTLATELSEKNIAYHIIDETVMEKYAKVENGVLVVGNEKYNTIIFPKMLTLGKFTAQLFEDFYAQGGKMLFTEEKPRFVEGQTHEYSFKTNTTWQEVFSMQEYLIDNAHTKIQSTMRVINGKTFIYAVNLDDKNSYTVTFNGNFKSFLQLDLETLNVKEISNTVNFEPNQSYVLFLHDKKVQIEPQKREIFLNTPYKIVDASDNYFVLDKLQYSFDGITYSPKLRYMGIFNQLIEKRYKGKLYLKYSFWLESVPKRISFLAENVLKSKCYVNGNLANFDGCSDFEKKLYKANIADFVQLGLNEVVLETEFYQKSEVYKVLLGKNVTEGLKNKLEYSTSIEACYLQGDFGVYSRQGFVESARGDVLLSDDFYIAERKTVVYDTVKDGYPFFAGNMTFEKTFIWQGGGCVLNLKGRYCLSRLVVNGKAVKKSYFSNKIDISNYLVKGNNTILITFWSGNRNLFGPHHLLNNEDPTAVGPYSFELKGTWQDGISFAERSNYSFVRFGLFGVN